GHHTYFVSAEAHCRSAWAHNTCVNRNRRSSRAPNHGYVIYDTTTEQPSKFGVSAGRVSRSGVSYRAQRQVNAMNRAAGRARYESVILTRHANRARALNWEARTVGAFRDLGHRLPGNKRPAGIPFAAR